MSSPLATSCPPNQRTTIDEAKHKLTRLEVRCKPKACGVMIDSAAASAETSEQQVVYVEPGDHQVPGLVGAQGRAADQKAPGAGSTMNVPVALASRRPPPSNTSDSP